MWKLKPKKQLITELSKEFHELLELGHLPETSPRMREIETRITNLQK